MSTGNDPVTSIQSIQEQAHGADRDYEPGSPHLTHPRLRAEILTRIRGLVADQFARHGRCRVLEVGAGHGAFTDHVLAMGAEVTITEMSRPSLDLLQRRFANNPSVTLVFDEDGTGAFRQGGEYDLVLCVSVLHHIPDYVGFADEVSALVAPGGTFASFQDPTYYPRRSGLSVRADRAMYLAWRVQHGNLHRGLATQWRRVRGVLDETSASDMSEYHVVRQGVDEQQLHDTLARHFGSVDVWRYFSTQGRWMQALGERTRDPQTFGIVATRRR